jgi:hypothetical protein
VGVLGLSKQATTLHNHREVRLARLFHPPGEGDGRVRQPHPDQELGVQPRHLRLHAPPRLPILLRPEDQEGHPFVDEEAGRAEGEEGKVVMEPRRPGLGAS